MNDYQVTLIGNIEEEFEFSHENNGEVFFKTFLLIERESGAVDSIPIIASIKAITGSKSDYLGRVCVLGEIRTRNYIEQDVTHLGVYVFVDDIFLFDADYKNQVNMIGYVCKTPNCRKTKTGRFVSDTIVAVNRRFGKSDYIPCVFWGRNAKYSAGLQPGDMVEISGRIQSRVYVKKENGVSVKKTTYEISSNRLTLLVESTSA